MTSVFVRIALRYIAAALIARGFLTAEDGNMLVSDPDLAQAIEIGIGAALGVLAEVWHWFAIRAKKVVDEFRGENV